jgi:two-component system chemotaxis sensor kinase CheA
MSDWINQDELIATFVAECDENLGTLEQLLVVMESSAGDREVIDTIFRCAHTLKGNAATLGLESITRIAHVMEDVLDKVREGKLGVSRDLVSLLLRAADRLRQLIPEALAGRDTLDASALELLERLGAAGEATGPGTKASARRERNELGLPAAAGGSRRIRVDMVKLDRLLNTTGELVIASGRARTMAESLAVDTERENILECLADIDRLFIELQEQVTRVRMVPAGIAFEPHRRTVRDVAEAAGKNVRLVIEGAQVEVDAAVIELIKDPLTHMIRNAVDHGIESAGTRVAAGKSSEGTISLRASHDSGAIVIEVADDGAGLDRQAILARARARGIIVPGETPVENEIDRLIFLPGFTTAEAVSEMSGRGVGMDVVHRNVGALRGTIDVQSSPGRGLRFVVRLPLTLAILDGLAVEAGGERFVFPLPSVEECIELPPSLWGGDDSGVMEFRGAPLPFVRLGSFYELDITSSVRENAIIVNCGKERLAIVADRLLGEVKAVMKPAGKLFRGIAGITGTTLFGDGRVGLIVDPASILRESARRQKAARSGLSGSHTDV